MSSRHVSRRSPARPPARRNKRGTPGRRPGQRSDPRTGIATRAGGPPKRGLSARGLALLAVLTLLMLIAVPTINAGIRQIQQINALESSNKSITAEIGDLKTEQTHLKNPEYLARQARAQQQYVKPGEKAYVVIDDRTDAQRVAAGDPATDETGQQANKSAHGRAWYLELVDSLKSVGLATQEKQ